MSVLELYCEPHLYVPNAFTQDNDGVNDYFKVSGTGIVDFEMYIYDCWGIQVFYSNSIDQGWNGSVQNGLYYAGDAIYDWIIEYSAERNDSTSPTERRSLQGHITVVR